MDIREMIIRIVESKFKTAYARLCTVVEVYADKTADVDPIDGGARILVKIMAGETTGMYMKPKVGSVVCVSMTSDFNGVIVGFSELDEIVMLDGSYGGLTKTPTLKAELDKTNEVVQALVDSLTGWTVVASDGGAALKAFATAQLSGKAIGDFNDIESDKVTHGI